MFHDISNVLDDKTEGIRLELEEMKRLQNMYINEVIANSLVKRETLEDYITRKAQWYIPAEEAIKLKLADGYYKY